MIGPRPFPWALVRRGHRFRGTDRGHYQVQAVTAEAVRYAEVIFPGGHELGPEVEVRREDFPGLVAHFL